MHDVAYINMTLDITTSAWLINFCFKTTKSYGLRNQLRNFVADLIEKYQKSVKEMVNDSFSA